MSNKLTGSVKIRPLSEDDLNEADRIMRTAFGTFLGLPDPMSFMGDADYVRTRWAAEPASALAAEVDCRLVGSNFVTRWGSVGFFGPLTVVPSLWDRGVARAMLDATMAIFDEWGVSHRGLYPLDPGTDMAMFLLVAWDAAGGLMPMLGVAEQLAQ